MWSHVVERLRCPQCRSALQAVDTEGRDAEVAAPRWYDSGALLCDRCHVVYPIQAGVPILLNYRTRLAHKVFHAWPNALRTRLEPKGYDLAAGTPPPGEKFVGATFSTEWRHYDYGATLWTGSTSDRLRTFQGECGLSSGALAGKKYCEIGCGLGILTNNAAESLGAEAWGIDLSSAVFRAASQFKENRRVHFVQASVFHAPFSPQEFDFVYSHGVLHHTWSTHRAVEAAASLVRPGGTLYVWLYGYADVRVSIPRRIAYALEVSTRPILARAPSAVTTSLLATLIPIYQLASFLGRKSGTHGTTYTARQALHAIRDRFTPLFAHRHEVEEVAAWLHELGFANLATVKPEDVAKSWSLAMERNVAIRGQRASTVGRAT